MGNESGKMVWHGRDVSGNQHATITRSDLQNFRISSAVRNHSQGSAKIDRRFPAPQSSPDLRI